MTAPLYKRNIFPQTDALQTAVKSGTPKSQPALRLYATNPHTSILLPEIVHDCNNPAITTDDAAARAGIAPSARVSMVFTRLPMPAMRSC
jgi:hypothetical protein